MAIDTIIEFLGRLPKPYLTLFGFFLVLVIGSIDTFTSVDISVSLLYFLPIIMIAWFEGGLPAILISIFSAITWALSDLMSGHIYSNFAVPLWNTAMMLGMFMVVSYSVATAKKLFVKEREHAHIDDLTGIANIRFFYEQARIGISKAAINKRPLTLAYIAVDNLPYINNTFGHIVGDYLLHEVAQTMMSTVRSADIISRLGGATFAILMQETKNESAIAIMYTMQAHLLNLVKKHGWPVTFDTSVVTCDGTICTLDELIATAEGLISAAGKTGKNMVKFKILDFSSKSS
jgi:diguanylate cyclase (GGDEF)-like protein